MWLYKGEDEVYCDKEQVQQFLDQGWLKEKPVVEEKEEDEKEDETASHAKRILKKVTKE